MTSCSFEANVAARGGAVAANGIGTWLRISNSSFAHNNASLEGGALAVGEASVTLSDRTRLHSNTAPTMRSVSIRAGWTGQVAYTLPAPPGHWLAGTFPCIRIAGLSDRRQPCQLLSALPDLEGAIITMLPVGDGLKAGGVDEDYPYPCGAGFFGDTKASSQTSMRCSGLCPAGYMCPSGTAEPLPCEVGSFCAVGSSVATRCAPGTYSTARNLTSASQCFDCPLGHVCTGGVKWPCGKRLTVPSPTP